MLIQPIQSAITSLSKNKGRTFLTVLGVVIGITAVIAVLSTGQAIEGLVLGEIDKFGSNFIQIEVKTPNTSHTSTENAFSMVGGNVVTTLTLDDAKKLERHPNVTGSYAGLMGQKLVTYESTLKKGILLGTGSQYIDIDSSEIDQGRWFTEQEDIGLTKVAVLGSKMKDKLFGDQDPINESIKIGKEKFRVVGYLETKGASFGFDFDDLIYIPVQTLQKRMLGIDYVSYLVIQINNNDIADQIAEDFRITLREEHGIIENNLDKDDFAVTTMDQMKEMMDVVINGIQILLIALGSISLIVGGVGIMNIMYVSVTERTFEIGLRKALGAKKNNILFQFLAEAVIITLIGVIVGIFFGISISLLISVVATALGLSWEFSVSWVGLLVAIVMSGGVGLIFGLYPAKKAADKNAIEALRHE